MFNQTKNIDILLYDNIRFDTIFSDLMTNIITYDMTKIYIFMINMIILEVLYLE